MAAFDEYLDKHGIVRLPQWGSDEGDDPSMHFVPAPEKRDGVRIGGCVVNEAHERVAKEFLDRFGGRYRTTADITRSAFHYFILKVIGPAMGTDVVRRVGSITALNRLEQDFQSDEDDSAMIAKAEKLYKKAPGSISRERTLRLLRAYVQGTMDAERQSELMETLLKHETLGEPFREYWAKMQARPIGLQDGENPVREGEDE